MANGEWRMLNGGTNESHSPARSDFRLFAIRYSLFALLMLFAPAAAAQNDAARQQFLFAYKLMQRGDDRLAGEAFDDYLGQFPEGEHRGDALYYRALLFRQDGRSELAGRILIDVPPPTLVPGYALDLLRGQVYSDIRDYDRAIAALERIETDPLEPAAKVSVLYLRGLAYRGAGNLPAAAATLEEAAALDTPMRSRALLDLATTQVQLNQPDEAIATLEKSLATDDGSAAARAARLAGDLSYNARHYDRAIDFYQIVITRHQSTPHFGPAVVGVLRTDLAAGRPDAVLAGYERHIETLAVQDRVTATYLAGSAAAGLGDHERAATLLEPLANSGDEASGGPLREKALYKLAASRFELEQYDAMRQAVDRLKRLHPQSELLADAAFLVAAAEAKTGDPARGAALLTELIAGGDANPYYRQALLRRAQVYESAGQTEAAAEDYLAFIRSATAPSAEVDAAALRLIDLSQRAGRHDTAIIVAQQMLERPRLATTIEQEAMYRLAMAQLGAGQTEPAMATLDTLQKKHPVHPWRDPADYYRGVLRMSLGNPDAATPLLEAAAGNPSLEPALRVGALRLIAIRQREANQPDNASASLEQLAQLGPLETEERLWLARHRLERDDPAGTIELLGPPAEPLSPADQAEALFLLGQAQRAQGQPDAAAQSFGAIIAAGQGRVDDARLALARVLADQGQYDRALAELAGLLSDDDSRIAAEALFDAGTVHRMVAAERWHRDDRTGADESRREAQRLFKRMVLLYPLKELEPLPQLGYVELADLAAELGDTQAVAAELDELIAKYPDGPYAVYAKAVKLADQQKRGDALALLKTLNDQPMDPRLTQRVTRLIALLEQGA